MGHDLPLVARPHAIDQERSVKPRALRHGVPGGHKIFRDAVWGELRFVFLADHRRYREIGFYDFPQKQLAVRRRFIPKIADGMLMPFRRVIDATAPERRDGNGGAQD